MAWDGSGGFSRTDGTHTGATTWATAASAGDDILTSTHDTHDQDLATGIGACLTKNNESKPTANFAPNASASYDLGTASLKWRNAYLSGSLSVGTGVLVSTATANEIVCTVANTWYDVTDLGDAPHGLVIFRDNTSAGLALYGVQGGGVLEFGTGSIGNFEARQAGAAAKLQIRVTGGTTPRSIEWGALKIGAS